jgi:hypothetical protein
MTEEERNRDAVALAHQVVQAKIAAGYYLLTDRNKRLRRNRRARIMRKIHKDLGIKR